MGGGGWWWVVVVGGGGGWKPTLVLALGKGLSFEAFHLTGHPLPILAWPLPELHNIFCQLFMNTLQQ